MNRLQLELHRLYVPGSAAGGDEPLASLVDASGRVRALVMELSRPASWEVLGKVWHGVQSELELPAPGIAVSGTDGLQLWFSLDEPIAAPEAHAFLEALRARYLPDVPPRRIRLLPAASASSSSVDSHARCVPAAVASTGNWSAFIAADLAPVFADTPWLDIPPSEEGQASLLRGLQSIKRSGFDAARARLVPFPTPPDRPAMATGSALPLSSPPAAVESALSDPESFLRRVLLDDTVALALRIEAAKALLPYGPRR